MDSKYIITFLLIVFIPVIYISLNNFKLKSLNQEIKISNMEITSTAFDNNQNIPSKFSCDGQSVSPALKFSNIPDNVKSLALIVEDPDAPLGTWTHWIVWNIPPSKVSIEEGEVGFGIFGTNSSGHKKYDGPCPPNGEHRYFFKLYALNSILDLNPASQRNDLLLTITDHIIVEAELMGKYSRN